MKEMSVGIPVLAIFAVGLVCWGCGGGGGPASSPPSGDHAAARASQGDPLGDPPTPAAEPEKTPDRSSPEAVLRSILDGRAREDLPYLARCEAVTAEKARLDSLDTARAWRYYCMAATRPRWDKIEGALETGRAAFTEDGDLATGTFEVGGALGTEQVRFARIGGEWYIQYDQE